MNINYILLPIFLIVFKCEQVLSQIRVRHTYGAACNALEKCEGNAWLKCHENICNCTNPEEMKWDPLKNRCEALAGEKCVYESIADGGIFVEKINCVENSACNLDGYCECSSKYYASSEGLCTMKKNYGNNCTKHEECNSDVALICSSGKCSCDSSIAAFSRGLNRCVGLVTESPILSACVPNAIAVAETQRVRLGNRKYTSIINITKCFCIPGFIPSLKKTCIKPYSDICSKTESCDEDAKIVCKRNTGEIISTCQCRDSKHQFYNATSQMCTSLINGICNSRIDCTENSICIDNESNGVFRCECKTGYVVNSEGNCDLEFGSQCNQGSNGGNVQCDKYAELVCENNVCSCGDKNLVFDKKLRKCVGVPGSRCSRDDKCLENSECVEAIAGLGGICECKDGFKNMGVKCEIDDNRNFIELETTNQDD